MRPRTTGSGRIRCTDDVSQLLLAVLARTVLWTLLMLAAWSTIPAALGWHVTTVVSGSMAPAIRVGDVVAAMPTSTDRIGVGHVVLVDDPDRAERLRLHRVERLLADGSFRLRGDANSSADRTPVTPSAVHGVGMLRFPVIGLPGTWIGQGDWTALATAALALAALGLLARSDHRILRGSPCSECGAPRSGIDSTIDGTRGAHVPVLAVSATVVVLSLVATTGASASFTADTETRSRMSSSVSFPCFRAPLDGAVLAWDFDEKHGDTVLDRSGNGHDATTVGDVTRTDGSCAANPHLTLRNSTDSPRAIATTTIAGPTTFSVEAWFRTDRSGAVVSFGSESAPASALKDRRLYVGSSGALRFGVQGSSGFSFTVFSTASVTDGRWHHAVGTSRPGRMELWLDGTLQGTRSDNTSPRRFTGHWRVGRESVGGMPDAGSPEFVGDIDTVRVHDRVLDGQTIAEHTRLGR